MYLDWEKKLSKLEKLRKVGVSVHDGCAALKLSYGTYWNWHRKMKKLKKKAKKKKRRNVIL